MTRERCTVAVIPAAGRGTRMRPATNAVPKALLPIVDRPAIDYVVREAADAGATEIVLVVDPEGRQLIRQHFAASDLGPGVELSGVVQEEPRGLGDAILRTADRVGARPFMCLLADNIARPDADLMGPLLDAFDGTSVVALNEVRGDEVDRYGIVAVDEWRAPGLARLGAAIEKPGADRAPSNLALVGRYVFAPDAFDALAGLEPGYAGEVQLTDAIDRLARQGRCLGAIVPPGLLDMGRPIGLLEATAVIGLSNEALRDDYLAILDRERRRRLASG